MSKYLKLFDEHSDYETYVDGDNTILPNISYCKDEENIHYNDPKFYKFMPFWKGYNFEFDEDYNVTYIINTQAGNGYKDFFDEFTTHMTSNKIGSNNLPGITDGVLLNDNVTQVDVYMVWNNQNLSDIKSELSDYIYFNNSENYSFPSTSNSTAYSVFDDLGFDSSYNQDFVYGDFLDYDDFGAIYTIEIDLVPERQSSVIAIFEDEDHYNSFNYNVNFIFCNLNFNIKCDSKLQDTLTYKVVMINYTQQS